MRRPIRSGENVTEVLIRAVADEPNKDPTELRPLGDSIDPDAIDSLFTRSSVDGAESLTILYEGCWVTIEPDTVTVEYLRDHFSTNDGTVAGMVV